MSSVLVIVSIAFAGFLAYIIGERIHEIRTALICNESTERAAVKKSILQLFAQCTPNGIEQKLNIACYLIFHKKGCSFATVLFNRNFIDLHLYEWYDYKQ